MADKNPKKPVPPVPKKLTSDQLNDKYSEAAQRADSGDINRITLEKGDNTVRIIDPDFRENFVVFIEDTEGNNKRVSMGMNMAENKEKYAVLFNAMPDAKASHRYYFKAIQGKKVKTTAGVKIVLDNEVKLLEVGPTIFKQISAIQTDPEFPDVHEINLKITRTGEKLKTDYQVMPSPKASPLPKDLVGDVDLDALVEETPLSNVYEYLGEEYNEDDATVTDSGEEDVTEVVAEEESVEAEITDGGDGFDDMNRQELLKYNKQYDLGIVVYKNWTDDQIRDAIRAKIAELQAQEAESVEQETEVEAEVTDETTVEEDDLSDLDDLDDLEEETKPEIKKPSKPSKK